MKNKLVSILVCTLLIATVLSVTGINDASQDEREVLFNNEIVSVAASSFGQFDSLSVEISKPEKALYVNDVKMFPLF
ncbi:MAG TPA: hypothetical protein ENI42_06690, partial [Thermoplasmatales archaeon]|nr:hypothetical protein [Thermoplasmatales archaeon]